MRFAADLRRIFARSVRSAPVAARALLTPREAEFCRLLRAAAAPFHVAPQVAMGALLDATDGNRARFDRRIVDYVILDDDGAVLLLVELDDRLHDRRRDAARDAPTAAAGYRTLRVEGVAGRDLALLTAALDTALGRPPRWQPPQFSPATSRHRARSTSAPPNTPRA